jgi:hypothetical protein
MGASGLRRRRASHWIELHGWKLIAFLIVLPGVVTLIGILFTFLSLFLFAGLFGASIVGLTLLLYLLYIRASSRRQLPKEVRDRELDVERRLHLPAGMLGKGPLHLEDGGAVKRREKAPND